MNTARLAVLASAALVVLPGCGGGGGGGGVDNGGGSSGGGGVVGSGSVTVLAWNDLGMHCLNPSYDRDVILPPYNNLWVQVVSRGDPPRILTTGVSVEYRLVGNTTSYPKRAYGGFWDHAQELFGATLEHDRGLNLVDPQVHNGLSGTMVAKADHFEADGIPVVPVDDANTWNPYQVAEITVKDGSGAVLAQTRATVPTSDEIHCDKCHGSQVSPYLELHDRHRGTRLAQSGPFLCASCHGSPALGMAPNPGPYLSTAIHSFHARVNPAPACYDCHPGARTQCSRSLAHTAADGNCTACHLGLAQVGGADRTPWLDEPRCLTCHGGVAEVDTGTSLYRHAAGHGGILCAGCHGSPHAMVPSREASDNAQAIQYQGAAKTLGSCGACHSSSRGAGLDEFSEAHGGSNPEHRNACHVCHTVLRTTTSSWPHAFGWKARGR